MIDGYLILKNEHTEVWLEVRPPKLVFLIKITKPNGEWTGSEIALTYDEFGGFVQLLSDIGRALWGRFK